jgi:hypothetical protein
MKRISFITFTRYCFLEEEGKRYTCMIDNIVIKKIAMVIRVALVKKEKAKTSVRAAI